VPTVFTHPVVPLAVRAVTGGALIPNRLLWFAAAGSAVPDLDTLGFLVGIPYGSLLGHRGLTHSVTFALLLACCALPLASWLQARKSWVFGLVFLSAASHGLLDALTDDGLGVAFWSPFSNERFFLPWRPIPASPIGVVGFFSLSGLHVLASELLFLWLPYLLVAAGATMARRLRRTPSGRGSGERTGTGKAPWPTARKLPILAIVCVVAAGVGGVGIARRYGLLGTPASPADRLAADRAMLSAAIENLERQAAKLAAQPGAACPQDFSTLATGGALRIGLFYGYDDHDGEVHDRAHAQAMAHLLTSPCRDGLSTCGFSTAERASPVVGLAKTIGGRRVEVNLYTSSQAERATRATRLSSGSPAPARSGPSVREHFLRELVESDIVFYMGHSRLGGSIGFDEQSGLTTLVDAVSGLPMLPVLEALRQRPTRLRILGMFSCDSNRYFRRPFQGANPALSLILTTGEVAYGPAEQASLGALEAVLSQACGHAFHRAMISTSEPEAKMTYLFRGR
jgi:inner membrane protein